MTSLRIYFHPTSSVMRQIHLMQNWVALVTIVVFTPSIMHFASCVNMMLNWVLDPFLVHVLVSKSLLQWVKKLFQLFKLTFLLFKRADIICKIVCKNAHQWHLMLLYLCLQTNLITRTIWVHPLNDDWYYKGEFYVLYPDMRNYLTKFFTMYRISVSKFDELLELLKPVLLWENMNYQTSISPEQRLVLALM